MKNKATEKETKTTDNKQDKINHPQKSTKPSFNSTTEHRNSDQLPQVEDLNQELEKIGHKKGNKSTSNSVSSPKNDNSLHGKNTKTDLGDGKPAGNEKEKEKIIRT